MAAKKKAAKVDKVTVIACLSALGEVIQRLEAIERSLQSIQANSFLVVGKATQPLAESVRELSCSVSKMADEQSANTLALEELAEQNRLNTEAILQLMRSPARRLVGMTFAPGASPAIASASSKAAAAASGVTSTCERS